MVLYKVVDLMSDKEKLRELSAKSRKGDWAPMVEYLKSLEQTPDVQRKLALAERFALASEG